MNRRHLLFVLGIILIALGTTSAMFGKSLPEDIDLYTRISNVKCGETNLPTLVGIVFICLGVSCILYWIATYKRPTRTKIIQRNDLASKMD